ncbi:MAG TPA: hypothetical protein VL068_02340, partial [Microthrixaceae bacterium]|nr:hypothetical protein [Microthrixaceae bacterium]
MKVEAGLAGVVSMGVPLPVRITITAKRARTVVVHFSSQDGESSQVLELGADAPTVLDVALRALPWIEISVRDSRGANLQSRSLSLPPDPKRTVIGVGPSLFAKGVPAKSPTIGGIQQASLLALTDELLDRPGALRSLSAVVLDAADLDKLDESTSHALREWVWAGGDLVLDVEPRAQLPIVGEPSTGRMTAIGSGWVRFTSGAAEGGAWSTILEPAPVRSVANNAMDQGFVRSMFLESGGLVSVGFLPTWIVALAVFGSALLAGPVAWFALRTRRNRRLIWGVAPGLSLAVAVVLLFAGQGVFTAAKTMTVADIDSSPFSETGTLFSGLKESKELELGVGGQLIAAIPDPHVSSSGSTQTVSVDLARNSFGSIGVGGVTFDEGPKIEVRAVALDDGKAEVTVTNHSKKVLRNVSITGNGRLRQFTSVQPGKSETLPFEMSSEINVLNPVFADPATLGIGVSPGSYNPIPGLEPIQSRGMVMVSGMMQAPVKAVGLSGTGLVSVRAIVPVQPAESQDGTAALRLDEVGGITAAQRQFFIDQGMDGFGDGGDFTATTVAPGAGADGTGLVVQPTEYVRMTSQRGRPAQACGVSTSAPTVEAWNGQNWELLEKVGEPYMDPRVIGFQPDGHEMQDWMIPA